MCLLSRTLGWKIRWRKVKNRKAIFGSKDQLKAKFIVVAIDFIAGLIISLIHILAFILLLNIIYWTFWIFLNNDWFKLFWNPRERFTFFLYLAPFQNVRILYYFFIRNTCNFSRIKIDNFRNVWPFSWNWNLPYQCSFRGSA